jgi:hypothetical protein
MGSWHVRRKFGNSVGTPPSVDVARLFLALRGLNDVEELELELELKTGVSTLWFRFFFQKMCRCRKLAARV